MANKHVFWRDGSGSPSKDDKWAPRKVLAEIGKKSQINDKGNIQWNLFDLHLYDTTIRNKVVICNTNREELNGHDAWNIIRHAISEVIKKDGGQTPITLERFTSKANELSRRYFTQPTQNYNLVSSMSLKSFPFKWTIVEGYKLYPYPSRSQYPLPNLISHAGTSSPIGHHIAKTRYKSIRVRVSGRTIHEALHTGLAAINHLRALWNLFATLGSWSFSMGSSKVKPLCVIHGGPVHTLHYLDGNPVDDLYWYEPNFVCDQKIFTANAKKWDDMEKWRKWATKQIQSLPYGPELKHILNRYGHALDSPNLDIAFIHMWSILEKITGTIGTRYDETVKRAVRLMEDREISIEMIEAIRSRRNQYVHSAQSADDSEQIAYMIKSFVDQHLIRLLWNDFGVSSINEYGEILSLSADRSALSNKSKNLARESKWVEKMIKLDKT